jgi:hypothetical protein
MNYSYLRLPGQTQGDWYVADSSSIAQAVLCTAQLTNGSDRARYLASSQQLFFLVEGAYTNPDSGTSDGIWGNYRASWWASTAIFGAFAFALYEETGLPVYLERGLKSFDWLSSTGAMNLVPTQPPASSSIRASFMFKPGRMFAGRCGKPSL